MFTKKTKRYLMLLAALGLVAVAAGRSGGTFAGFNAEVANNGNTFLTGTLFLHDNGGTNTCTSESDSLNSNSAGAGCDVLFNPGSITPGQTYTAHLTLSNAGTLEAQDIKFKLGNACTDAKPTIGTLGNGGTLSGSVSSITVTNLSQTLLDGTDIELHQNNDANTQTFTVTGGPYNPGPSVVVTVASQTANFGYTSAATISLGAFGTALCSQLTMTIQEDTDGTFGTPVPSRCAFPASTSATCGTPTTALDDASLASLQTLQLGSATGGNSGTNLSAGKSRYFTISIAAPGSLANNAQNDAATFGILWHIDQV